MENMDNCFCHFNGFRVKDAEARQRIKVNETKLQKEYEATPATLAEIVASANAGATIKLAAGEYDRLNLHGVSGFPENLTIVGGAGVKMAGISITSGVLNDNLLWYSDVSNITLPGGLVIRDVTLTDSFSLRNACIDGLQLINVHITSGGININPNAFKDKYGKDGASSTANRFSFQGAIVKNLLIKGCTIDDVSIENNDTNHAIYIKVAENITIQSNKISAVAGNAVQIVGADDRATSGNIRICDNTIPKSRENAIRVSHLKDAQLFVVRNVITNCALSGGVDKYIYVTNCENTFCKFKRRDADGYNTAEGNKIDVDNGVYVEGNASYVSDTQHKTDIDKIAADVEKVKTASEAAANNMLPVELRDKVSLAYAVGSGGSNLTYLEHNFNTFKYIPALKMVFFEGSIVYNGTMAKGDAFTLMHYFSKDTEVLYTVNPTPVLCGERYSGSDMFVAELFPHNESNRVVIRALNDINTNGEDRCIGFSGWYFAINSLSG